MSHFDKEFMPLGWSAKGNPIEPRQHAVFDQDGIYVSTNIVDAVTPLEKCLMAIWRCYLRRRKFAGFTKDDGDKFGEWLETP